MLRRDALSQFSQIRRTVQFLPIFTIGEREFHPAKQDIIGITGIHSPAPTLARQNERIPEGPLPTEHQARRHVYDKICHRGDKLRQSTKEEVLPGIAKPTNIGTYWKGDGRRKPTKASIPKALWSKCRTMKILPPISTSCYSSIRSNRKNGSAILTPYSLGLNFASASQCPRTRETNPAAVKRSKMSLPNNRTWSSCP